MPTLTDQRQGFLDAIIAEPADDVVRLVFADWLEDHGEPERGEFIRVQVRLATDPWVKYRCPTCGDRGVLRGQGAVRCASCPTRQALRRREGELLRDNLRHWFDLPNLGRKHVWRCTNLDDTRLELDPLFTYCRGFVTSIALRCEDWVGRVCEVCEGQRTHRYPYGYLNECGTCHGTGRVGAHGPSLVRACPLETVRLSDKRPLCLHFGERAGWWIWSHASPDPLPPEILSLVRDQYYSTEADALDGLSRTLLAWARSSPIVRP